HAHVFSRRRQGGGWLRVPVRCVHPSAVGPASKIKEMRRLEALTSLSMLTHRAMFTAWETGKLPADHDALMDAVQLRPEYLYIPEGKGIRWDAERRLAVSDAYNTLHFATPL